MGFHHFRQWATHSRIDKQLVVLAYCHTKARNSFSSPLFLNYSSTIPHLRIGHHPKANQSCPLLVFCCNPEFFVHVLIACSSTHHQQRDCSEPDKPPPSPQLIPNGSSPLPPVDRLLQLHRTVAGSRLFPHDQHKIDIPLLHSSTISMTPHPAHSTINPNATSSFDSPSLSINGLLPQLPVILLHSPS